MRILGIDPGLRNLGWGVIDVQGSRISHVANGICHSAGDDLALRLLSLHGQLTAVISAHLPTHAAVEQTFVNKDGAGTLKLGQARGIAVLVPAQFGLAVGEYAPNAVKKAVVGAGHADKVQVAHMVRLHLPGVVLAGPDAADALAIAICHAHHLQSAGKLSAALSKAVQAAAPTDDPRKQVRRASTPDPWPDPRPDAKPDARPDAHPDAHPDAQSADRRCTTPVAAPASQPAEQSGAKPAEQSGAQPATDTGTREEARADVQARPRAARA